MAPASYCFFGFFCDSGSTTTSVSTSASIPTTSSYIAPSSTSTFAPSSTSTFVLSSTSTAQASSTSSAATALKISNPGIYSNCYYTVDGANTFNTRWVADWTTGVTQDLTNIVSSSYAVGAATTNSTTTASTKMKRGLSSVFSLLANALSFKIASQGNAKSVVAAASSSVGSIVSSANTAASGTAANVAAVMSSSTQLYTSYNDILYGSVRAVILLSNATGFTSFRSDTMEIDLNWLNYHSSYGSNIVADASTAWHEYRVDWLPGTTSYYIDTKLVYSTSSENSPGLWLWNAWSTTDADSVFQMRSIDAYFNRTSVDAAIQSENAVCTAVNAVTAAASSSAVGSATSAVGSATNVVGSVVNGLVSPSSSVTPTPTTLATSTKTPSVSAQATVSFTTVSSAWTGKTTSTTTQLNGLSATVIVLTPGVVQATTSSAASSGGYVYMTTTTDSGTFSAVQTSTVFPKRGTTATVQIIYPTPATTCGNVGIAYAGYTNSFAGGQATSGYPKFNPTVYKTAKPTQTGTTNYIAEVNSGSSNVAVYGRTSTGTQNWVLDHTFYLFARQDGYYSFNIPYTDDIQMLWYGDKAVSGWTRANADIVQFWSSQIAVQTPQTVAVYLTTGSYLPCKFSLFFPHHIPYEYR